jgi:hypothetical protein
MVAVVKVVHHLHREHHQGIASNLSRWTIETQVKFFAATDDLGEDFINGILVLTSPVRQIPTEFYTMLPQKRSRWDSTGIVRRVGEQFTKFRIVEV